MCHHNVRKRLLNDHCLESGMDRDPPELHLNHYWFDASPVHTVCMWANGTHTSKHSVTFKNDPYPVLLQFTKKY